VAFRPLNEAEDGATERSLSGAVKGTAEESVKNPVNRAAEEEEAAEGEAEEAPEGAVVFRPLKTANQKSGLQARALFAYRKGRVPPGP
jgi:hypothetical protein